MREKLASEKTKRLASNSFEVFAANFMRIRTKTGAMAPLAFNRAQRFIHEALEEQRRQTGKVRALILKGRQMGCSTYVGARFYFKCSRTAGLRTFILTHEDAATANLFEIVQRFHDNLPADLKPSTGIANAKELVFNELDSGYKIGTAHNKAVGRSNTVQLFHGSEVAHWQNADAHAAGVMQAIPNTPDTECILESTANGIGGFFHRKWREAERGESDFIPIFTPWWWDETYRIPVGDDFTLSAEEREHAELYGLDPEQIAWRRGKVRELGDAELFRQEYPANAAEAFQMSGHDSFIAPVLIARARANKPEPAGPLILGFDPAWKGTDRHSLAWRRGRCVEKVISKTGLDTMQAAGWVAQVINKDKPARVFIDVGGVGAGVCDRLKEMGLNITAVNFGSAPFEPAPLDEHGRPFGGPANRRAEMWLKSREWLEGAEGVSVPDSDSLQADACAPGYKYDSNTRLILESKDDMRRRGVPSPDEWDAVALTFAEPVSGIIPNFRRKLVYPRISIA